MAQSHQAGCLLGTWGNVNFGSRKCSFRERQPWNERSLWAGSQETWRAIYRYFLPLSRSYSFLRLSFLACKMGIKTTSASLTSQGCCVGILWSLSVIESRILFIVLVNTSRNQAKTKRILFSFWKKTIQRHNSCSRLGFFCHQLLSLGIYFEWINTYTFSPYTLSKLPS